MENFGQRRKFGNRRRSFDGDYSQDKPVKEGETYDVEIIEVGSKGDGIAKVQNFVIFVPNTQKGDKVKIRITRVGGRSAVGEVVSSGAESAPAETKEAPKEEAEETEESEEEPEEPEPDEPGKEPEPDEPEGESEAVV